MGEQASKQRRWGIIAVIVALLVLAVVVWALTAAGGTAPATPSSSPDATSTTLPIPSATTSPAPSASSTSLAVTPPPAPSTAVPRASDAPIAPEAPPVGPTDVAEQQVDEQGVVRVELARVEHVDGQAIAPGEIAGPAVRLSIEVSNDTAEPIDAGLIAVNAYFGEARTPGNSLMQPGGSPFGGSVAPGEATTGVYLFEADDAALADVLVGVDVVPGLPTFTFRGDLR